MANDITSINSSKTQQTSSRQTQRTADAGSSTSSRSENQSATTGAADKVSLTSTASRLKDIEQRLANQTGIDEKRVDAMRTAIDNGRYEVDADRVADKMLNFESNLRS